MLFSFFYYSIFSIFLTSQGQFLIPEICDNALDDDGDGLIDLNDPDCKCYGIVDTIFIPSSLIPNPSFEDYINCPDTVAQLDRCRSWIQASSATSDYYHTCGFTSDVVRGKPPQPLPAGNGYVGFLDIQDFAGRGRYKEYVGACLTTPMLPGKEYTLSFWIGFGTPGTQALGNVFVGPRRTFNMGIFASSDCTNLPFGGPFGNWLCPTAYPGWFEMTRVSLTGRNAWIKTTVKLRPSVKVETLVLGPACAATDGTYYYWLDELILEESTKFDSLYFAISGNPCSDTVILKSNSVKLPKITHQWYKDGVAIPGANEVDLAIPKGEEGRYQLRAFDGKDCELSNYYDYEVDTSFTFLDSTICAGNSVKVAAYEFDTNGVYKVVLPNYRGCDSIIELNLKVNNTAYGKLDTAICIGSYLEIQGERYDQSGSYGIPLISHNLCDSVLVLNLKVVNQFNATLDTLICEGEGVLIDGVKYNKEGSYQIKLLSVSGCDSLIDLNIRIKTLKFTNVNYQICSGDSLTVNNEVIKMTGLYQYVFDSYLGCDSIVNISVVVNSNSYCKIDTNLCSGELIRIGGIDYGSGGNYLIHLRNSKGCDSLIELNLTVRPMETINLDTGICEGSFLAIGNKNFSQPGIYRINLFNQFGCDSTINLNLTLFSKTVSDFEKNICRGETLSIWSRQFFLPGIYQIKLTNSLGCDSLINFTLYEAYPINVHIDTVICYGTGLKIGNQYFDKSESYYYQGKSYRGCDSTFSLKLEVLNKISILDSLHNNLCQGDSSGRILLTVAGGKPPYNYYWNDGSKISDRQALKAGQYKVTITDAVGCEILKEIELRDPECFCFNISTEDGNCENFSKGNLSIVKLGAGKEPLNYFLNSEPSKLINNRIFDLKSGSYQLDIVDANGCSFSKDFKIDYHNNSRKKFPEDSVWVFVGDSIYPEFYYLDTNGIVFQWSGNGLMNCRDCKRTSLIAQPGINEYHVVAVDENGCEYEYSLIVSAKQNFFVPNVFSPNGDLQNDYFNLYSDPSIELIDLLQIYDRWGGRIFESRGGHPNSPNGAWFGESQELPVNPGVYVYLLKFRDKTGKAYLLSGDVTLVR
ncbi:MAG: gliding motility-associated C-terminal domain-containing protein [Saprospiraceae bacterium]|nr:gliding motility-associated C-terminal domain-containing protein [Candidatus Vicinibacter affinis]